MAAPVFEGGSRVAVAAVVQAGIALGTQILLARWLGAEDFGLFALALSASFVLASVAGGGLQTYIARLSSSTHHSEVLAAFKRAVMLGLAASALTLLSAPVFARVFGEPDLSQLIALLALSLPFRSLGAFGLASLQRSGNFGQLSTLIVLAAAAQSTVSLFLSAGGLGALGLVWGVVAHASVLGSAGLALAWVARGGVRSVPTARAGFSSRALMWPLLGELGAASAMRIDYLVLGLFAPTGVVGVYFFAFQLVARASGMLGAVVRTVVYPNMARRLHRNTDMGRDIQAAGAALVAVSSVGAALFIAFFGMVESALWGGRWSEAVVVVAVLASVLPLQIAATAPEQLLKATGRFRGWTLLLLGRSAGMGVLLAGYSSIWKPSDALAYAAAFAAITAALSVAEIWVLGGILDFDRRQYLGRTFVTATTVVVGGGWLSRQLVDVLDLPPARAIALSGFSIVIALTVAVSVSAVLSKAAGGTIRS